MTLASWLDRVLYRYPFEGASARRYANAARPAFGDLDDRLLDALAPRLGGRTTLLDVGAGPCTFSRRAAVRFPDLSVVAIEPSRDFAQVAPPQVAMARAAAEALPLAAGTVDVAICLSSIRHVRDRARALAELRRVVRGGGVLVIVELDPAASARRIAAHGDQLGTMLLRRMFGPLVVRTAPTCTAIEQLAHDAGWATAARRDDPVQPVYILELQ